MKTYLSYFVLLFFSICSLLHAAEKTYTYNFNPYGSLEVTINGHTPAEHCIDKSPNTGGKNLYLMLPHCSQRFWDPADLLKYKTTCKFTPNPGFILTSPQIVPNKYDLDKMADKDSVALPKSKQVAGFNLKLDKNHSDYEEREKKGYNNGTITVVIQTPTILLTAHAPGEFGTPGMKAYRPLTEGEDTMTVDAAEKKHGYVAVLRRNDDNDDGKKYALDKDTGFAVNDDDKPRDNKDTEIPETELTPGVNTGGLKNPRPVAFDPGKRPDNDLVAIKLDLKKPEGFVFNKVNINLNIPAETNFYGADRTYRKPDYWMNGVSLDTKSDGALGDLTEKGTVTLYCEGKGKSDPSEKAGFTNGDTSLKILGGQLRETKSEVFLFYLDMLAHYQGSIKGKVAFKDPEIHLGETKTFIPRVTDADSYDAFLMQNADFDENKTISDDPWLAYQWHGINESPLTSNYNFLVGDIPTNRSTDLIKKRDCNTTSVSLDRDDDFSRLTLKYYGAEKLLKGKLEYKYEVKNNLQTYYIQNKEKPWSGEDLKTDLKDDPKLPWLTLFDDNSYNVFVEDKNTEHNAGGSVNDSIDKKYDEPNKSIVSLIFKRGNYEVSTKIKIHRGGNFNYQYSIATGQLPSGNLDFSSGRGLVRFGKGKNDWRFEKGHTSNRTLVVNSGRKPVSDYKQTNGPTPPGMWYCIRRTTYGKHRAAAQWDFSEKKIMYSGHMSLWDKANTYNKNTIAAQAIDSDLIKDVKFLNFPFWKVGGNGADPRRSRRIRYKYQIGIIQNTNTIRDFSNDGGKKRTELQVHPDGGPPGSHGCNNAQTLNEASVIYRVLRWRKPIPYFIENK